MFHVFVNLDSILYFALNISKMPDCDYNIREKTKPTVVSLRESLLQS